VHTSRLRYVELGEAAPAEAALRKVVVAPVVARLVTEHKKQHIRPGKSGVLES
jgi:hypothetical protein